VSSLPIERMILSELRATGRRSTRWFQWLFAGKIRHFFACGSGRPDVTTAVAPASTATAAVMAMTFARIGA
jgi:hypothetical protein